MVTPECGTAELVVHYGADGAMTVRVVRADDVIGVTPELLRQLEREDGHIVLDAAGEYRFRRVGETQHLVLFERVRD